MVAEAFRGTQEGDLPGMISGLSRVLGGLSRSEENLSELITNFRRFTGSFAAQDEALGRAIDQLPDTLEAARPVLRQHQHGLTEAGELLLRHAEAIVSRLSAARADMDALGTGQAGTLRVGVYQSVGQHILPTLMSRFVDGWPRVEVSLEEAANDVELLGQIERGELDLTFADLPLPDGPFEHAEVLRDPYVLVLPADADDPDTTTLAAAAGLDLIGFRHCRGLNQLESFSPEPLRFVFRSDHNGTVQGMVAAGLGAAVVPRLTVDEEDERVRVVELDDVPPRTIAVVWHRDRHRGPSARAFVGARAAGLRRARLRAGLADYETDLRSWRRRRRRPSRVPASARAAARGRA